MPASQLREIPHLLHVKQAAVIVCQHRLSAAKGADGRDRHRAQQPCNSAAEPHADSDRQFRRLVPLGCVHSAICVPYLEPGGDFSSLCSLCHFRLFCHIWPPLTIDCSCKIDPGSLNRSWFNYERGLWLRHAAASTFSHASNSLGIGNPSRSAIATACGRPSCAICNGRRWSWLRAGYTSVERRTARRVSTQAAEGVVFTPFSRSPVHGVDTAGELAKFFPSTGFW
jgi:hypothetical protein